MTTPTVFTVLAFDPGNNTGIAVCSIDVTTRVMTVIFSQTLVIDKVIRYDSYEIQASMNKEERRKRYLRPIISQLLEYYSVDAVIYESAFVGKSIVAYDALKTYGEIIRECAHDYYWDMMIQKVSPSKVKTVIGAVGKKDDKNQMTIAVANHPAIRFAEGINIADMTEHAIDAIAIGYVALFEFIGE